MLPSWNLALLEERGLVYAQIIPGDVTFFDSESTIRL